jgi:hypothetical protein
MRLAEGYDIRSHWCQLQVPNRPTEPLGVNPLRRTMVANGRWRRSTVYEEFQWARVGALVAASVAAPARCLGPSMRTPGAEVGLGRSRMSVIGRSPMESPQSVALLYLCAVWLRGGLVQPWSCVSDFRPSDLQLDGKLRA